MDTFPFKAMMLVLSVWVVLFVLISGFGLFISRCFGLRKEDTADDYLKSFWIGWAFIIFVLQIWNFYFRVDGKAFILTSIIAVIGVTWNWRNIYSFIRLRAENHWCKPMDECEQSALRRMSLDKLKGGPAEAKRRRVISGTTAVKLWDSIDKSVLRNWGFAIGVFIVAIFLSNSAIFPPLNYDSGLYHLSSVEWAKSYPVIPGLGNLHGRLAFNSSYFLYVAWLETLLPHKSHHFANGILLLVLFMQIFSSSIRLLKFKASSYFSHSFILSGSAAVAERQYCKPFSGFINIYFGDIDLSSITHYFRRPAA